MIEPFWNRTDELAKVRDYVGTSAFGYVTGRRRVGKTALLVTACEKYDGLYHQAVEGTPEQQLIHVAEEFKDRLPIFRGVLPKTWSEFFALLSKEKLPPLIVFDEFPYWVQGDSTLPSILQKWIDHQLPQTKSCVIVSGSSQTMLHSQFLAHSSPMFGRSSFRLDVEPMSYEWFCKALRYEPREPESFARFSIVGGVPHYWKLLPKGSLLKQITELYFAPSAILAEEPRNIFRDEGIAGTMPKAIIDLVGRGVAKPSEIASRLGVVQGNLSRPLSLLLDLGLIYREIPFGESSRSTKKVHYSILDQSLSCYYRVFLPLRSRWGSMSSTEKHVLLNEFVSVHWENYCRGCLPGAGRYWEKDIEIDIIAPKKGESHLVAECKWANLSAKEEERLLQSLDEKFRRTTISKKLGSVDYRILSKKDLSRVAEQT